jgi:hypothetical protein
MTRPLWFSQVFFICLFSCLSAMAQGNQAVMTNADVVEMVKAGIGENTIVLAIQKGMTSFDTSPAALVSLKQQGLSDRLLAAMLEKRGAAQGAPSESTQTSPEGQTVQPFAGDAPGPQPQSLGVAPLRATERGSAGAASPTILINSAWGVGSHFGDKTRIDLQAATDGLILAGFDKHGRPTSVHMLCSDASSWTGEYLWENLKNYGAGGWASVLVGTPMPGGKPTDVWSNTKLRLNTGKKMTLVLTSENRETLLSAVNKRCGSQ